MWVASKSYRTRGEVKIRCGDGSRKSAEEQARRAFVQRDQAAEAGRTRWRKTREQKARAAAQPAAAPAPIADPPPELDEPEPEVTPIERPTAPPPPAAEPPRPAANDRAEQIRAKLLALGDGQPIEADSVHPPGEDPRAADDDLDGEEAEGDNEAGELLSEMIAGGVVIGHVKLVTGRLKKKGKRPGEANERFLSWEREGIRYHAAKLFGNHTRMSPFMKMCAGIVGTTFSMYIDAEEVEAAPAPPAAAAPPAADPPAAPPAPPTQPKRSNVFELAPLGRFR